MTAALLAVALCLLAAGPASAADDRVVVVSGGQSDSPGVVGTAQSDGGTDTEPGTDRRLVERESSERVDAVVIALWTIAGVMTVLLGVFLWHTSPRRRLRLAGASAELFDGAEEDSEVDGGEPGDDSGARGLGLAVKDFVVTVWERMVAWTRSRVAQSHVAEAAQDAEAAHVAEAARDAEAAQDAEAVGDGSEQESVGDSEDESAVWRFGEKDDGERSV